MSNQLTSELIQQWYDEGNELGMTSMIILWDGTDNEFRVAYVAPEDDLRLEVRKFWDSYQNQDSPERVVIVMSLQEPISSRFLQQFVSTMAPQ